MIGQRLQQLRLEKGLSLSEFAERAGIAKSYLSSIERDIQGNPSIQVLEKLCGVLEISVPALLAGEQTPETSDVDAGTGGSSLDAEWLNIVREAMKSGINKEEFKQFLEFQKWKSQRPE